MIVETYLDSFVRDLNKVREEISLYKNENDLWTLKGDIKNSGGTLALHLIGNLKDRIGTQLGGTGYVRNRDKEFTERNVPRKRLLAEIDETISILKKVMPGLKDTDLGKEYPLEFLGEKRTISYMLLFLATHLNYHLGQINYHRRLTSP